MEVEFAGDSGLQRAWDAVVALRDNVEGDGDYLCLTCFPEEPGGAGECPVVEVSPGVQLSVQEASAELPKGPRRAQSPGSGGDKAAPLAAALGIAAAAAALLLVAVVAFVRRRAARRTRGAMASKLLSRRGHWSSGAAGIQMQEWEQSALGTGANSFAAKNQRATGNADEEVAEDSPLAGHWEEHIDPDSGRPYYFNQATGEVQWAEGGVMMTGAEAETARRATVVSESNPLLEGGAGGPAPAGGAPGLRRGDPEPAGGRPGRRLGAARRPRLGQRLLLEPADRGARLGAPRARLRPRLGAAAAREKNQFF